MNIKKLTHAELLDAAVARVAAKWPTVDAAKERAAMADWTDYRLATAYADLTDAEIDFAARAYSGAPGWDSADLGGISGHDPLA